MCLVAFQKMFRKIFSGVWLCFWKYHRKQIFYLLLTFSHIFSAAKRIYNIIHSSIQKHKQNPEKKIIKSSHIFSVAKQIYNIIHSSIQKRKQNPGEKKKIFKSGQIERRRKRERWLGSIRGEIAQRRQRRDRAARCCDRDRRKGKIAIDAVLREIAISASRDRDWRFARSRSARCFARSQSARRRDRDRRRDLSPFACLWVVLSLSLSPFARLWAPLFARLSSGSDLKVK